MLAIVLVIVAILVGTISAMAGLGGGFLVVPILVLFFHVETHQAVGTSTVMVLFTALSAALAYARQRRIDYKAGLILAVGTVPGALAGAYMTTLISGNLLEALFGAFLLFMATQMMRNTREVPDQTLVYAECLRTPKELPSSIQLGRFPVSFSVFLEDLSQVSLV